jgi:sigma-B regulation protein RsbU (phosphoserine phosphatase)
MELEELLAAPHPPPSPTLDGDDIIRLFWKYRGLLKNQERAEAFWSAHHGNLRRRIERLDNQEQALGRAMRTLQDDLQVASRIQGALLPQPDAVAADGVEWSVHHRQLTQVGGDYYDFFRTRAGRTAIGLFDISGHGVAAALIMAFLKARFIAALEQHEAPRSIVESVNETAHDFLRSVKHYSTVNFVVLHENELRYACGGGFGLLLPGPEAGDAEPQVFTKRDPFLGLRRRPYTEHRLRFGEGDVLAMYTDGIPEGQDREGRDYTVRRLNGVLAAHRTAPVQEIVDACVADFEGFRAEDTDDRTLIVLRRNSAPARRPITVRPAPRAPREMSLEYTLEPVGAVDCDLSGLLAQGTEALLGVFYPPIVARRAHVAMTELVDNVTQNISDPECRMTVRLTLRGETLRVRTSNAATIEQTERVRAVLARLGAADEPLEVLRDTLRERRRMRLKGGLGLLRLVAENKFRLSASHEGGRLEVSAELDLGGLS